MRIAYVLTSLGVGGAERQALALAERMAARGHTVALLVIRGRQSEQWPTTLDPVHFDMCKTPASFLACLWKGRRFLRDFQPDLIHSHTYPANMMARLLKILTPGAAVLSTVHNVYEGRWPRMLAYRFTDPLSRHITAISQAAADRYVRLKAVPSDKMSVLVNGIDTMEFAPSPERRAHMREEMGAGDEFIWLTAGRIVPAKDYPNLMRSFARVTADCSKTTLWVAGDRDVDKLSDLFILADELCLRGRVRWLGLRRDMPALLDAADGFVLASAWEGLPLAVGEALAMEKQVVATDVGGVRELVGETGFIVPAKNPERLAEAMLEMMRRTDEECRRLGQKARERIVTHFSMDAKADEWETLYRKTRINRR
jgi:glycosyltransferase involved in cell wall biosynthesis